MYARGMNAREIVGHLHEVYGIEVSPDLVTTVSEACWRRSAHAGPPAEVGLSSVFFEVLRVPVA